MIEIGFPNVIPPEPWTVDLQKVQRDLQGLLLLKHLIALLDGVGKVGLQTLVHELLELPHFLLPRPCLRHGHGHGPQ